jgi:hypothetical protein
LIAALRSVRRPVAGDVDGDGCCALCIAITITIPVVTVATL